MKKLRDIKNRADIEKLVNSFYEEVKKDPLLNGFFERVSWEKHLPVMCDFWENVLLFSGNYMGNPMQQHKYLHQKMEITKLHFDRWLLFFNRATDKLFVGPKATLIKEKAANIADVMQLQLHQ